MKRLLVLIFVAVAASGTAVGQTNSWISVQALPKGVDVVIERKNDEPVYGMVKAVTADMIAIVGDRDSFLIGRENVKKIYIALDEKSRRHANHGALIGMIVGAVAISLAAGEPEGQEMPGLGGLIGGGVAGAWIGSKRDKGPRKGDPVYVAK